MREKSLDDELARVLVSKNIDNTLWQLVYIIEKNTINQAKYIAFRDFGIIFISFILGILLAFITIMKHERLRFHAESKLDKLK